MDSRLKHLAMTEQHIAEGRKTIARQEQLVADLDRDGHDTTMALALLRQFQVTMAAHIDHRDRLRAELGLGQPEI